MIKVRPRKDSLPLTELDHVVTFNIRMEFARELVGYMHLGPDFDGTAMFMGKIWEHIEEEDLDYPAANLDLRVKDGIPQITCCAVYARGLLTAWAEQFMSQPMIIQVPA